MVEHLACGVEAGWEQRFAGRRLDVRTAGEEAAWVFGAVEGFIWRWECYRRRVPDGEVGVVAAAAKGSGVERWG
jgi:hypothetical protein